MSKLVLVSFADNRYRNALKRLEACTKDFPFTERHFHNEKNTFDKQYWRRLKPWLYRRGYGYWEWKGQLVQHYLDKLDEGDFLVYSDAEVYWNATDTALKRFAEYLSMFNDKQQILAFQESCIEQEWTKGDVLQELGVYNDQNICNTAQLWGGCFILRKSEVVCEFVDEWCNINKLEKEYITDKRSESPNKLGFKEHRHDQSSFSILVKKLPHIEISYCETTPPSEQSWQELLAYPIQGRRHKLENRPLGEIVKNKLLRPWRMILNIYFRKVRKYEYIGGYSW